MINHEKEAPISRIQLRKTDEAGQNLAGAVFKVEFRENENGPWETYEEGLSSGTDGLVTTVVEKKATTVLSKHKRQQALSLIVRHVK